MRGPVPVAAQTTSGTGSSQNDVEEQARMSLDERLLFFPSRYPDGDWDADSMPIEDVWMTTEDGVTIHGWYCRASEPRAHLLYAHGNAGNISHRRERLRQLYEAGISALIFDYRGYGRSEGQPTKEGILKDARAAREQLAALADIDESDIVLLGRSLGGAVVVQLASESPARGLVLESTFASLHAIAKHHYPLLAWIVKRNSLNSEAVVAAYRGPLLQSHGDADRTIPLEIGKRLFDSANEPKQFVVIPGGTHNSPQSAEYDEVFQEFIGSLEVSSPQR